MRKPTARGVVIGILALFVGLTCAYGVGVWYFQTHYYPGMVVAGQDAGLLDEAQLAKAIDATAHDFRTTLRTEDFELEIAASDLDVRGNGAELAHAARERMDENIWPLQVLGGLNNLSSDLDYDASKLEALVNEAVEAYNKDATYPTNARIELNEQASAFEAVPEEPGTALDPVAVRNAADDALRRLVPQVDLADHALAQADVRAADQATQEALTRANNALYHTVSLEYEGNNIRTLGYDQWVELLGVGEDLGLTLDAEAFASWADVWLWQGVDHADKQSAYVLDVDALATDILDALEKRSPKSVEVPTKTLDRFLAKDGELPKASWDSSWGRYVEVNIGEQYARLYGSDGIVVWESVVTTGNEPTNPTPRGTYYVYDKKTDFTLLGEDEDGDGKYDYEHHVDFWMPFNEGVGLHDASWRKSFGGDVYLTKGSGGCVNLKRESAAALFQVIHVGDKVVVHD